ncbi:uncharacterized protein kif16bb [Denticeps clupeoides]|uniref:uncharacterized protein kif16bb n=1 Tax=Denticeps clupeoides TaxID=299321 RepID=UPI0010A2DA24|nr:uncharacterized protein LOC114795672 [Denticeps clupeoides]
MASVRVAVRVRPLNPREMQLSSKTIIQVEGNKTSITDSKHMTKNSEDRTKCFSYDFSYDSTDVRSTKFVSQEKVFTDLGTDVLKAAFEGYNACVFAYGQTGSGKSYTMMGSQGDVGLTPRICEGLFNHITETSHTDHTSFHTVVSYVEIYNERVRDLLRNKPAEYGNLRVREHPRDGPYVEGLSKKPVKSYADVAGLMDQGNTNRTVSSTAMNEASSRSHAIFTINFTQARFDADLPSETVSKIHLVDLAGSERADATRATGAQLKEGGNINKSLVTLGNVISTLAEASVFGSLKKKQTFIPYRDSVLTWLLKDSLGGNSKTIMIATISPADINYGETLSTLRYANRAKNIVNKPTVNEDGSVKIIRELREEIAHLNALLAHGNKAASPVGLASGASVEEKLHQNEARVIELTKEWTSKWKETQSILREETVALRKEGNGVVLDSELPHLIGIDDDLLSTGVILYHLREGRTSVGRGDATTQPDIMLHGIESEHCAFENRGGTVILTPFPGAPCLVNGVEVTEPCPLTQGAVLQLGRGTLFRFNHPKEAAALRQKRQSGLLYDGGLSPSDLSSGPQLMSTAMWRKSGANVKEPEGELRNVEEDLSEESDEGPGLNVTWEMEDEGEGCIYSNQLAVPDPEHMDMCLAGGLSYKLVHHGLLAFTGRSDVLETEEKSRYQRTIQAAEDYYEAELRPGPPDESCKAAASVVTADALNTSERQTQQTCSPAAEKRPSANKVWEDGVQTRRPQSSQQQAQQSASPHKSAADCQPQQLLSSDRDLGLGSTSRGSRPDPSGLTGADGSGAGPEGGSNERMGVCSDGGWDPCLPTGRSAGTSFAVPASPLCAECFAIGLEDAGGVVLPQLASDEAPLTLPELKVTQKLIQSQAFTVEGQFSHSVLSMSSVESLRAPAASEAHLQSAQAGSGSNSASGLGSLLGRMSWMVKDAGRILRSSPSVLPQMAIVGGAVKLELVLGPEARPPEYGELVHAEEPAMDNEFAWPKEHSLAKKLTWPQEFDTELDMGSRLKSPRNPNSFLKVDSPQVEKTNGCRTRSVLVRGNSNKQAWVPETPCGPEKVQVVGYGSPHCPCQPVQVLCQRLVDFPSSLRQLQCLPVPNLLSLLLNVLPASSLTTQKTLAVCWLSVGSCSQLEPSPALVVLLESVLFVLTSDPDPSNPLEFSHSLSVFHHLPLFQIKEVQVGFAGQSIRLMGSTASSILTLYTYSPELTQDLCCTLLAVLAPGEPGVWDHPLLTKDLRELSLDWGAQYVPDLLLAAGLRLTCNFQKTLAHLVCLLHGNMDGERPKLGQVQVLLYAAVRVHSSSRSSSSLPANCVAHLLLTDTHLGLLLEDAVFYPQPRSLVLIPRHAQFRLGPLRCRSNVRCLLVRDSVQLEVVLVAPGARGAQRGHQQCDVGRAAAPSSQLPRSSPRPEVWKLTFSSATEATFLINNLSNI